MSYVRLKKLTVSGFRSIVPEAVIEFPASGMMLVRGRNLNTGGSSGSGKTNVLLAIQFALGICPLPATALQSWLTEKMSVELVLDTAGGDVVVSRSPGLSLRIGDQKPVKGRAAEAELQRILGLDPALLEALTYRRQQSRGQFLCRTDSEKKEFLTTLLGLGRFENAIEDAQDRIRALEPRAKFDQEETERLRKEYVDLTALLATPSYIDETPLNRALEEAAAQVSDLQQRIAASKKGLQEREKEVQASTDRLSQSYLPKLQDLQAEYDRARQAPVPTADRSAENETKVELDRARAELATAQARDRENLATEQAEARRLQRELDRVRAEIAKIDRMKDQGMALMGELEALEKHTCPTCHQTWVKAQERKAKIECDIEQLAIGIGKLQETYNTEEVERLQAAIKSAYSHIPHPDISRWQEVVGELSAKLTSIRSENDQREAVARGDHNVLVAQLKSDLEALRSEALIAARNHQANAMERLNGIREEIEELERGLKLAQAHQQGCQSKAYQAQLRNVETKKQAEMDQRRVQDLYQRLTQAQVRSTESAAAVAAEKDFLTLIGREGFLGAIFDEVLAEISQETNRILAMVPNVSHVVVSFRSEAETQKGTIKKTIVPVANVGGHETTLQAGVSGGMYAAIELAVDLAVASVVSRRTGAVPGWLVLDESFEGLGVIEKEGCLQILQGHAQDKVVLVVDHASEVKEMFTEFIDVTYEGDISTVKVTSA